MVPHTFSVLIRQAFSKRISPYFIHFKPKTNKTIVLQLLLSFVVVTKGDWRGDGEGDGDASPPEGKSESTAIIRRNVTDRADLELGALAFAVREKMSEDLERTRKTRAWTRTNKATFVKSSLEPSKAIE